MPLRREKKKIKNNMRVTPAPGASGLQTSVEAITLVLQGWVWGFFIFFASLFFFVFCFSFPPSPVVCLFVCTTTTSSERVGAAGTRRCGAAGAQGSLDLRPGRAARCAGGRGDCAGGWRGARYRTTIAFPVLCLPGVVDKQSPTQPG